MSPPERQPADPSPTAVETVMRRGRQIRRRRRQQLAVGALSCLATIGAVVAVIAKQPTDHVRTVAAPAPVSGGKGDLRVPVIAFVREEGVDGNSDIVVTQPGEAPKVVVAATDKVNADHPSISPDGKKIAFASTQGGALAGIKSVFDVWTMDTDGSHQRRLTSLNLTVDQPPNSYGADGPAWSPDGKRLVYTQPAADGTTQLWIMNADGSNKHLFLSSPTGIFTPSWSPTGKQIAFYSTSQTNRSPVTGLWVADVASAQPRLLPITDLQAQQAPSWNSDGTALIVTRVVSGGYRSTVFRLSTGSERLLLLPPLAGGVRYCGADDQVIYRLQAAPGPDTQLLTTSRLVLSSVNGGDAFTVTTSSPGSTDHAVTCGPG